MQFVQWTCKDGILDIILGGGNQYEFKPQFARLDTSYIILLGEMKLHLDSKR
jgi:hypothetical protein